MEVKLESKSKSEPEPERLVLEAFSTPPLVSFESIPVGGRASRRVAVYNPTPHTKQIFIQKYPEVNIEFSWAECEVEPNGTAILDMAWCPEKSISQRCTVQIAEKRKGKYEIIIVFKSISKTKKTCKKTAKPRRSPFKLSKPKSPKQKAALCVAGIRANQVVPLSQKPSINFDIPSSLNTYVSHAKHKLSPKFDSYTVTHASLEQIVHQENDYDNVRRETYLITNNKENVRKERDTPFKKRKIFLEENTNRTDVLSAIDNLEFTPVKTLKPKLEEKQAQNISKNIHLSYADKQEDIYKMYTNTKQNSPHRNILSSIENLEFTPVKMLKNIPSNSYIYKSSEPTYLPSNESVKNNTTHPIINLINCSNASSNVSLVSGDFNNPLPTYIGVSKFEINSTTRSLSPIDINRCDVENIFNTPCNYSGEYFNPHRYSTEIKAILSPNNQLFMDAHEDDCNQTPNSTFRKLSSETYIKVDNSLISSDTFTKVDSPIIPIDKDEGVLSSSPYLTDQSSEIGKITPQIFPLTENLRNYNERMNLRNNLREKNNYSSAKSIIEANLWQKSPPRSSSPNLCSIPEESSIIYEKSLDRPFFLHPSETFILNKTFDKKKPNTIVQNINTGWKKTAVHRDVKFKIVNSELTTELPDFKRNMEFLNKVTVDVYSATTTTNPFLESSNTYVYDEKAFCSIEIEFKKWLNYLLTPPSDLDSKLEFDLGKVWIENRTKSVPVAPTREQVSLKYHTTHRLESLRKSAKALINTSQMAQVFLKVSNQVEKKILSIRVDKNLHLDIGLQKTILHILLCYNPLWLRIGLEATHDKIIPLTSNDDICGLSEFIIENVFRIPQITAKHLLMQQAHTENIKKHTLKKVLYLIYFLDQAKQKKIIFHDPCLFCRNAKFKESKKILFEFTKELLSGIGDITKHLRPTGYVVDHSQTYLNEFKYAVHNLAVDLKDGIRLTRLMEIILMQDNLTLRLRTPAISRLQKIHNVEIAIDALKRANFVIVGEISPRDIADGHREKTLSLLWQLINKFRAPLFEKSAIIIQKWWRKNYLKVWLWNNIKNKENSKKIKAANKIQSWWKGILTRRWVSEKKKIITRACIIIQKNLRMWILKSKYQKLKSSTVLIQIFFRQYLSIRNAKKILIELRQNNAASIIQKWYKESKIRYHLKCNNTDREYYVSLKQSVIRIQQIHRANITMKFYRCNFLNIKYSVIKIQQFYKSVIMMRSVRQRYLELKSAAVMIQNRFRANTAMKHFRNKFITRRNATIFIQRYYRNYLKKKYAQGYYIELILATIFIQKLYRSKLQMKDERSRFLLIKQSTITIQRCYRMWVIHKKTIAAKKIINWYRKIKNYNKFVNTDKDYKYYQQLKSKVCRVQELFRANAKMNKQKQAFLRMKTSAIIIQQYYRSIILTRRIRNDYLELRSVTISIQNVYRSNKLMVRERDEYIRMRKSVIFIQRYYKNFKETEEVKRNYLQLRSAAIFLQRLYRAKLSMNNERKKYLTVKSSAIIIQKSFRQYILKKKTTATVVIQRWFRKLKNNDRIMYLKLKFSVSLIQMKFRAYLLMKHERNNYNTLKISVITLQRYYRNQIVMRRIRIQYIALRHAAIFIQNKFRSKKLMICERNEYENKKNAAVCIQRYYRNYSFSTTIRNYYLQLRTAAIFCQGIYRAKLSMRVDREKYLTLKLSATIVQRYFRNYNHKKKSLAAITIQRWYRLSKLKYILKTTYKDREMYLQLKSSAILIQSKFRAYLLMRREYDNFTMLRLSAIKIQQYYKSVLLTRKIRENYLCLQSSAVLIQRQIRARNLTILQRNNYLRLRNATVVIQRYYRNYLYMNKLKKDYLELRSAAVVIQRLYRAKLSMINDRRDYIGKRNSVISIQNIYRAYCQMKKARNDYLKKRNAVILIQSYFKTYLAKKQFYRLKQSCITIQRLYRAKISTINDRRKYLAMKDGAVLIQNTYRSYRQMIYIREDYLQKRNAAICIQSYWRAYFQKKQYLKLKQACVVIQRLYRMNVEKMKIQAELVEKIQIALQTKVNAAVKIQSYWRGYSLRKMQKDDSKIKTLRKRWENGGLESQSLTIAERNEDAIHVLSRFKDIASVIRAFKTLDFVTNVYPMLYSNDETAGKIARSLILYMGAANRSVSAKETLDLGTGILINLTRYKPTAHFVYSNKCINLLLSLMSRWCDKDNHLSCSFITLLWLFGKYDDIKKNLSTYLIQKEQYKIISTVRQSIVRKKKMEIHKRNSVNNSRISLTPNKANKMIHNHLPITDPDYGISRSNRPKIFLDELDGIEHVYSRYDLPHFNACDLLHN